MPNKEIISSNQYVWAIFSVITSFATLQMPGMLILHAGRDAWLSVVLAWFLDVLLAIVYAYLAVRFPGQNFVQYSETILGKYVGKLIGLIFPFFFLLVAMLFMRSLAAIIVNMFLPKTPIELVLAAGYFILAYGIRKGVETVVRACEVLGPIYFISLIVLILLVLPEAKLHLLSPQFADGYLPFFTGANFILTFFGVCIIMGMFIPLTNRQENAFLAKFIAVTLASPLVCLIVALSIAVFDSEQAGNMLNPSLNLVRYIRVGKIIERLEIIWMMIAIAAGILTSANCIWAFCQGIAHSVKLSDYKRLAYPAAILAFVLSITSFDSNVDLFNFTFYAYPFIGVFVEAILELFLLFMAVVLKKRTKQPI